MKTRIPMKLFVVEPRGSGGLIHYAYQLCNALSDYITDVTLVTAINYELEAYPHKYKVHKLMNLWGRDNPLAVAALHNPFQKIWRKVFRTGRRMFRGIRLFMEWIKLTNYLIRERPDITQFGSIEFPFETIFLRYLKSKGLILAQIGHEFEPRERGEGLLVKINNQLLKNVFGTFSIIFFHSKSNQERFSMLYPDISGEGERFKLIPHGNSQIFPVNGKSLMIRSTLQQRYGLADGDLVVLFFGNITPSKGIPDLLRAFEKVHSQNSQVRLIVAGMPLKYIDMNDLFDLASRLGIRSVTSFDTRYLPLEEVGPLMELATVVVYPYLSSTQSGSIQVAYTFGKPVVATRVGGLPDVVEDGKSGFLVEPNSPDELSAAILKIINDPDLTKNMGLFAKQLSETRFAWGPIAGKIANTYQAFLEKN